MTGDEFNLVTSFSTLKYNTYHELCGNLKYIYSWTMQQKDLRLNTQLPHWAARDYSRNSYTDYLNTGNIFFIN